ncbi:protein of unknown function [Taphrina deformans PYCC 5710]|uniref:BRO1 domain-containing protein n=1 Tax=Taphrina deformans (strain PYCC 5710 / ATCC 11124 / CBS 356.35 / IMI 108563 / JCM 9778 / NBRC 8474) TaxID=1097556 RepID=R4XGI5_TAPDE|nr:protein of unknown function [Taphrina deformans PYCC 5710]|eukprot:CCG85007.1 protein of unknown function [Taphrina deformans PYCC 5710]
MTHNLLELPFKRTDAIDLVKCVSDLLAQQYAQPVEEFTQDIARLQELRNSIINASISSVGLAVYLTYHTQLCHLSTKFPLDIGADFVWYDPSSNLSHTKVDDLSYETANVLYNIAAIHAGMGLHENRSTAEGLKRAHQLFQKAAGCFSLLEGHLETVSFQKPEDLQSEYIACLRDVMLAQAQECIWQRAVLDHMKDKLIAQLSEQVSKFYQQALEALEKSTAITTSWAHHLSLKRYHFAAAAQVRMSNAALSMNKYGEEVARLRLATEYCNKAQQHAPYVGRLVAQDLKGLTDHAKSTSTKAERDNDMIYMVPVLSRDSLPAIGAQIMVKPVVLPELQDPLSSVSDEQLLFTSLVPIVIRNVVDIFEQRKQALISREITNKLHALALDMQALLQDLGLPGSLTVLEQPLGLPQGLIQQAEEVRGRGGSAYLQGLLDEVAALAAANSELVDQIVDIMDEEALGHEDEQESTTITGYRSQVTEYSTFLSQAKTSDELVKEKVSQWRAQIDLLASDETTLANSIPSGQRISLSKERESSARRVRVCLNRWTQLSLEREMQLEQVENFAGSDDITADLVSHLHALPKTSARTAPQAEDFEPVLVSRLARYRPFIRLTETSTTAQKELKRDLVSANTQFLASRTTQQGTRSDRERVVQDLDTGFHKFREIVSNLEEGAKFYTDFHRALCRVSDELRAAILAARTADLSVRDHGERRAERAPGAGTWRQEAGITFASGSRASHAPLGSGPDHPQNVSRTSRAFDPTKHTIKFAAPDKKR